MMLVFPYIIICYINPDMDDIIPVIITCTPLLLMFLLMLNEITKYNHEEEITYIVNEKEYILGGMQTGLCYIDNIRNSKRYRKYWKNDQYRAIDMGLYDLGDLLDTISSIVYLSNTAEEISKKHGIQNVRFNSKYNENEDSYEVTISCDQISANGLLRTLNEQEEFETQTLSSDIYKKIFTEDYIDFRLADELMEKVKTDYLAVQNQVKALPNVEQLALPIFEENKDNAKKE